MSDEQRIRDEYMRWAESPECAQGTAWEGYQGGYRARDAEVQALREALAALAEFTFGPEWQQPIECDQNPACEDCTIRGKAIALTGEKGSSDE